MQVLKFGGSSVANPENINKVFEIVSARPGQIKAVICSALGGCTDELIAIGQDAFRGVEGYEERIARLEQRHIDTARELLPESHRMVTMSAINGYFMEIKNLCFGIALLKELSAKSLDRLVSYGELLSNLIISETFASRGLQSCFIDSRQLIRTDDRYGNANVDYSLTNRLIREKLAETNGHICILPGFVASAPNGETTTLGRGGSDYTAAIVAAAIEADELQIYSDVNGMMTSNPRVVGNAFTIEELTYDEAMELSHFGAKVLYPKSIQPALKSAIPIRLLNTFEPDNSGTLVQSENTHLTKGDIIGISSISDIALLTLTGAAMVGIPGYAQRAFSALANEQVNVILITQSCSEHTISIGVKESDAQVAVDSLHREFAYERSQQYVDDVSLERELSIIALVGENMYHRPGISGHAFIALGENGINIRAIAQGSSERNISMIVERKDESKALNVIHEKFFSTDAKLINLFVAGAGNVGAEFFRIVQERAAALLQDYQLEMRIVGITNSRKMLIDPEGISLDDWQERLMTQGERAELSFYIEQMKALNLRNSIFVDNTASALVSEHYGEILSSSLSLVGCNKIACSGRQDSYDSLRSLARKHNVQFRYETAVGAALPILSTIQDLRMSGDRVHRIEAILSGSLNFIFNSYDGSFPFADIIRKAMDMGFTEPDPRIDLSGTDVKRKILILARESGHRMEEGDVHTEVFLPRACTEADSVEDFLAAAKSEEDHFAGIYKQAADKGAKLKFVASYADGSATVGLRIIPADHPFYRLSGKDNIVLLNTDRYPEQPLVIKGAGAGAEVTAAGVFSDIMRAANH